jgi:polyamine oxidase
MSDCATVIVVGAGAAGLGAARWLIDNDIHHQISVIVLEGRQRVGGRVHTTMDFDNIPVDLGACWIHEHSDDNPMSMMVETLGLRIRNANWESFDLMDLDGKRYPTWKQFLGVGNFESIFYGSARKANDSGEYSQSFEECIKSRSGAAKWGNPLFQAVLSAHDFELGTSLRNVSPGAVDEEWDYGEHIGGREFNMELLDTGFQGILDGLISGEATCTPAMRGPSDQSSPRRIDVRLGHSVRAVSTASSGDGCMAAVTVSVSVASGQQQEEQTDISLAADAVIMTVPLGVLKAGAITFTPPLSSSKQSAICRAGFGNVVKVVMEFSEVFWARDKEFILIADPSLCLPFEDLASPQQRGLFTLFWNFHMVSGSNILVSYGLGDAADAVDQVSVIISIL